MATLHSISNPPYPCMCVLKVPFIDLSIRSGRIWAASSPKIPACDCMCVLYVHQAHQKLVTKYMAETVDLGKQNKKLLEDSACWRQLLVCVSFPYHFISPSHHAATVPHFTHWHCACHISPIAPKGSRRRGRGHQGAAERGAAAGECM